MTTTSPTTSNPATAATAAETSLCAGCGGHGEDGSSRRSVLQGAAKLSGLALAAPVLAACGSSSSKGSTPAAGASSPAGAPTSAAAPSDAGSSSAAGGGLASTADIPVGGGKIFSDARIVVTQPTAGQYKAFSATCTHQGCTVGEITGGDIVCPCHGSRYSIKDGSVVNGPATQPLAAKTVTVQGTEISVS